MEFALPSIVHVRSIFMHSFFDYRAAQHLAIVFG